MKRAAVYARVSTKKEEQDNAFEASILRLRAEVERRGFSLVDVYADRLSGTAKATKKRARYQAMLELAASRGIDVVVVTRLDRLARSLQELMRVCEEFRKWDVDLVVLDQPIDTTTATGRLMFHILGAFAEFERDMTREKILKGLETAKARGRTFGRPVKAGGLIERVRVLRNGGASLNQILATLKAEGHIVTRSWVARRCAGILAANKAPAPVGVGVAISPDSGTASSAAAPSTPASPPPSRPETARNLNDNGGPPA